MDQYEKAVAFRAMHNGAGAFVIPNPWDAGTARILETLGFAALATTSAGLAFALGRGDGQNAVSRAETLQNAGAIVASSHLPVSADLENGFGASPEACATTIVMAAEVGLVGGSIEDATGHRDNPIFTIEHATERIRAAAEEANRLPFPFTLTARAENFLHGNPDLKDTIKRLQAFQMAGAHVLFAPGLRTAEDIRAVTSSVDLPVNVVMGLQGVKLSVAELSALGVKRISLGSSLALAALGAFMRAAEEVSQTGRFDFAETAIPFGVINGIFAKGN